MRKLVLLIVAAFVGLAAIPTTTEARGHRPLRGDVDVQFNMGVIFGVGVAADPETKVSYIGDITFGHREYTLVWFNVTPPEPGCTVCTVTETWSIYDSADYEFGVLEDFFGPGEHLPGVLTSFTPGELLLEGSDFAIGGPGGYFMGWGPVTEAGNVPPLKHFEDGRVFWFGQYDTPEVGPGTRFHGRFIVFPHFGR